MKKLSRQPEYDYGPGGGHFIGVGVGVASVADVGDCCGLTDGDSVAVGVANAATVAVGDDSGNAWDGVAGRNMEGAMSETISTIVPITAAIPPTFAQKSVF